MGLGGVAGCDNSSSIGGKNTFALWTVLLTAVLPLKLPKLKPVSKATILVNGGMGLVHRLLLVLAIRVSTLDKCCKSPVITGALAVSIITDLRPSEQRGQRHDTRMHTPRKVYLCVCESVYTCA